MGEGNQRASSRFRIAEGLSQGSLQVGGSHVPVQLCDRSAGGFCVSAEIQLDGDWYEVRVARVKQQGQRVEIGLERCRDLARPDDLRAVKPSVMSAFPKLSKIAIGGMGMIGVTFACLFGVSIWTGQKLILGSKFSMPTLPSITGSEPGNAAPARNPNKDLSSKLNKAAFAEPEVVRLRAGSSSYAAQARETFGYQFEGRTTGERLALVKLEFVMAATDDALAQELELTVQQRTVLRRLKDAGRQKLAGLKQADELRDEDLETIQQLHTAVVSVLNERQQQRLEAILTQARA
jgi:hypothetical protein